MRRIAGLVAVVCLCAGSVALAILAVPLTRYEHRETTPANSGTVSVVSRATDLAAPAVVELSWIGARSIRSPAAGLVTAVTISQGKQVQCGAPVLEIDGAPLMAYCAPRPLWREISSTSTGRDVEELIAFLQAIGRLPKDSTPPTAEQVRGAIVSLREESGREAADQLSPTQLVWIGDGPISPGSIDVQAGMTVQVNDKLFEVSSALASAVIPNVGSRSEQGALLFGLDNSTARFSFDRTGKIADLAALEAELRSQNLLNDALPAQAVGSTRLQTAKVAMSVPASAVISGSNDLCVLVRDRSGDHPVRVVPIDSSAGFVLVTGSLQEGAEVLVDPDKSTPC